MMNPNNHEPNGQLSGPRDMTGLGGVGNPLGRNVSQASPLSVPIQATSLRLGQVSAAELHPTRNRRLDTSPEHRTHAGHDARIAIAVLPFVNVTDDPIVDQLSQEFTGFALNAISEVGRPLYVTHEPKGASEVDDVSFRDIGRETKADVVLIGNVHVSDGYLCVDAQVVWVGDRRPVYVSPIICKHRICRRMNRIAAADLANQMKSALTFPRAVAGFG